MKLLIVDDEKYAIDGVMDGVAWDQLSLDKVLTANSATQAWDILEKDKIDIVICDIEMPDEGGLELISRINVKYPEVVCLILSCHDEFDYARQAVALRCYEYILKPVRYSVLTEKIQAATEEVKKRQQKNVLEEYGKKYVDDFAREHGENKTDTAEQTAAYIKAHISDNLSVSSLAAMAYVSSDHLTRLFKKKYHKTVSEYILDHRMQLAAELLKKGNMTITMISDSVGFGNYSYFTEQFKKYYGKTPRDYQASYREQDHD